MRFSEGKTISQRMAMAMLVLASLVAFAGLSGCSGGGSRGRYFAYIQTTDPAVTPGPSAAKHHAGAKHATVATAALKSSTSAVARPGTTFTGGTVIAGTDDIIIYDTHTNAPALDTGVAYQVESVQVSYDGTQLVASVLTATTITSGFPLNDGCYLQTDSATIANCYQLWVADVKFKTVTQITTDPADHYDATFSADGNTVAYSQYDSAKGVEQLFTVSDVAPYTETEVPTSVASVPVDAEVPVFTPDGLNLVFTAGETYVIDIVNIATGKVTQLTLPPEGAEDYSASVSPDGTQIAFTRYSEAEDNYVIPITGETATGTAIGLTTGNSVTKGESEYPMYLDNSAEDIVYLSYAVGDTYHVFEMERDGTTASLPETQLTTGPDEQFFNEEF
jgi:hypothetical protein